MESTIDRRTTQPRNYFVVARRWPLALLCGLLLACSALAQEQGRPEPLPTPDEMSAEAPAAQKAPDPNEAVPPDALADQSGSRGGGSQTVNGDIIFSSPGQFLYSRAVRLSDNFGVLRLYGADTLTTSPAGAAVQLFGNNAENFNGQLFLDSGAHDSSALIFRTARAGGALTERLRVTSDGIVGIGKRPTDLRFSKLHVEARNEDDGDARHAVEGGTSADGGIGVIGVGGGIDGIGVYGIAGGNGRGGVLGESWNTTVAAGVKGKSNIGKGVHGSSDSNFGVHGESISNVGVYGYSKTGTGVLGESTSGNAGSFYGRVQVFGQLTKSSGTFKIDHPLDPANKYLSHSFVESPDMMNIYNGNVTLDRRGRATVTLPAYFEALNREFRYQLTAVGAPANLYVAAEIKGNQFQIAGGRRGMKVSWQVTGVRQDAYAEAHRVKVEEDKPAAERGTYLHPEEFGQPAEKGVMYARRAAPARQPTETTSAGADAAGRPAVRQRRASRKGR